MLLPYLRKQSSRSFLVSGQAQHLRAQRAHQRSVDVTRCAYLRTDGFMPCGFFSETSFDLLWTDAFTTGSGDVAGVSEPDEDGVDDDDDENQDDMLQVDVLYAIEWW